MIKVGVVPIDVSSDGIEFERLMQASSGFNNILKLRGNPIFPPIDIGKNCKLFSLRIKKDPFSQIAYLQTKQDTRDTCQYLHPYWALILSLTVSALYVSMLMTVTCLIDRCVRKLGSFFRPQYSILVEVLTCKSVSTYVVLSILSLKETPRKSQGSIPQRIKSQGDP